MAVGRVVFVSLSEVLGGGELNLLRTAKAASAKVDVAIAGAPETPILGAARGLGLGIRELPLGRKLGRRTALPNLVRFPVARHRLLRFLAGRDSDEWTLLQYKWEQLLWGGDGDTERVAVWEHGPIPPGLLRAPPARARLARAFRAARAAFAWSQPARESIVALAGREPVMLAAGVDDERAVAAIRGREDTRARLGIGPDLPLLVFAGRLAEDKGVLDLVRALPAIHYAHALICGDGPTRGRLEELVRSLGLSARVHLQGFVDDPLPYLAAGDVTVLLSRSRGEGRPVTAVESNAVGTPVLGLAGSPALEHLAREGRVHLAEDSDPDEVRRGVERLLGRPRRRLPAPTWDEAAETFVQALQRCD